MQTSGDAMVAREDVSEDQPFFPELMNKTVQNASFSMIGRDSGTLAILLH